MDNNLKFLQTKTVEQFKAAMNVSRIDVKRNPKNGKIFFTYGAEIGAVSSKGIPRNPMLSQVQTNEGEVFWMLHEEAQGGAPTLASF